MIKLSLPAVDLNLKKTFGVWIVCPIVHRIHMRYKFQGFIPGRFFWNISVVSKGMGSRNDTLFERVVIWWTKSKHVDNFKITLGPSCSNSSEKSHYNCPFLLKQLKNFPGIKLWNLYLILIRCTIVHTIQTPKVFLRFRSMTDSDSFIILVDKLNKFCVCIYKPVKKRINTLRPLTSCHSSTENII